MCCVSFGLIVAFNRILASSCEATNRNWIRGRRLGLSTPFSAKTNRACTNEGKCGNCAEDSSRSYPGESFECTRTPGVPAVGAVTGDRDCVWRKSAEVVVPHRRALPTTGRPEHF